MRIARFLILAAVAGSSAARAELVSIDSFEMRVVSAVGLGVYEVKSSPLRCANDGSCERVIRAKLRNSVKGQAPKTIELTRLEPKLTKDKKKAKFPKELLLFFHESFDTVTEAVGLGGIELPASQIEELPIDSSCKLLTVSREILERVKATMKKFDDNDKERPEICRIECTDKTTGYARLYGGSGVFLKIPKWGKKCPGEKK